MRATSLSQIFVREKRNCHAHHTANRKGIAPRLRWSPRGKVRLRPQSPSKQNTKQQALLTCDDPIALCVEVQGDDLRRVAQQRVGALSGLHVPQAGGVVHGSSCCKTRRRSEESVTRKGRVAKTSEGSQEQAKSQEKDRSTPYNTAVEIGHAVKS